MRLGSTIVTDTKLSIEGDLKRLITKEVFFQPNLLLTIS